MAHTNTRLLIHIIFSTKQRHAWLVGEMKTRLFSYLAGIIQHQKGTPIIINGSPDHVHIFCELRAEESVATMVRLMKSNSSSWFRKTFRRAAFAWQEGYAAFSVSPSQSTRVYEYIKGQEEHHRSKSFKEEYLSFLKKHNIAYDERFVFED